MFAMPYRSMVIRGEELRLNPADPDERRLLVNPRLHLTLDEIIANQLWAGDPPEAGQAAQRRRDGGMTCCTRSSACWSTTCTRT